MPESRCARRQRDGACTFLPLLFEAAQILIASCGERAVYGTVGTRERFFLEWKEPYPLTVKKLARLLSVTALMEPPMSGLMEPLTGADLGSRTGYVSGGAKVDHGSGGTVPLRRSKTLPSL